jgi:hypothetical protein
MSKNDSSDGRQAGEFTDEESRIHRAGFKIIHDGLAGGLKFDDACAGLEVVDPEMRRVIIDDYLKMAIAEAHFQDKHPLEEVAVHLHCSIERLETARDDMMAEVREAAIAKYRKESAESGFDLGDMTGEPTGRKDN